MVISNLKIYVDKGDKKTPWIIEFEDYSVKRFKNITIKCTSITVSENGKHYLLIKDCLEIIQENNSAVVI